MACKHHWLLPSPTSGASQVEGRCTRCRSRRMFTVAFSPTNEPTFKTYDRTQHEALYEREDDLDERLMLAGRVVFEGA